MGHRLSRSFLLLNLSTPLALTDSIGTTGILPAPAYSTPIASPSLPFNSQLCTPFLELVAKLLSSSSASLSHKVHRCRAPCTVKSSSGTRAQTPRIVLKRLGKLREWTIGARAPAPPCVCTPADLL